MSFPSGNQPSHPDLPRRKILLVDDDRLNARILSSILKPEGYLVAAAALPGYHPPRHEGWRKVRLGLTTIDEIEQNTSFEWAT